MVLDRARVAAGLDTCDDTESHARYVAANKAMPTCDAQGNEWKTCAAAGCGAFPTDPVTGAWIAVPDRKCWCPEHREQAGPDDDAPPERAILDWRTAQLILPPSEVERLEAEQQLLRDEDDERNRRREAEAEATRRARQRYVEENRDNSYAFPDIAGIPQSWLSS